MTSRKQWLVIMVLISSLFIVSCKGNEKHEVKSLGNRPANVTEFGFVVQDGRWLYYMDGGQHNNIVRTDGDKTYLYPDTYGSSLNLYKDYIYYRDGGIYRIPIDHPEMKEQITFTNTPDGIIVNEDLYYTVVGQTKETEGIYRMNLKTLDKKILVEEFVNDMQWYDGWIFYCIGTEGKIMKMRDDGRKNVEIKSDVGIKLSTTHFVVADGWIYFQNRNRNLKDKNGKGAEFYLCRVRTDGSDFEIVVNKDIGWFNTDGKFVFYSLDGGQDLYRRDIDGKNEKKLFDGKTMWVNIIEEDIYFLNDWNPEPPEKTSILYRINKDGSSLTQIAGPKQ